tara:strand:+ start:408 stop:2234 length:1827 start_codon:yes stop_codon:yes gene_type:complete
MPYLGNRPDNIVVRNAQQEFNYTATSSQTTFTGADTNNNTLAYNPGNVEVFFNGARLEEADFTATNGTSVVLASAASAGDLISIVATDVFEATDTVSKANGGTFSNNIGVSGILTANNITTTGYIRGPSSFTIDPASHGDNTGTVVIAGDLTVNGTTTTVNSNTVNIGDNILVLNSDETGTPSQNAGIEVERGSATNVTLRWNETTDKWQFTNDGSSYEDIGAGISVQEEGSTLSTAATTLNFVGSNVTATGSGATKTITIGGGDVVADTTPQLGGNLDINSNDITGTGNINTTGNLDISGTAELDLVTFARGTGNQMIIANKFSSGMMIRGNWLRLQNSAGTADMIIGKPGYEVELYYNGSQKLETTNTGITVTGVTTSTGFSGKIHPVNGTTTNYLSLKDSNELNFYNSSDASQTLHINYDGGNVDLAGSAVTVRHSDKFVGIGTTSPDEKLQVIGSVDIGPTTIPWTRTSASGYNSLSLSGDTANSSGFLYLGNGASATNADFDLYRILGYNGTTQVSQISTVTNTGANDDGRIEFYTKSTGASLSSAMTLEADGRITAEKSIITNPNTISTNTTLPSSSNSMAIGPITLNATLTIPNGSSWTIV